MESKCRTCMGSSTTKDVSLKEESQLIIKIGLLIGIQISILENYSNICAKCIGKIDDYFNFRQMVIETNSRIQKYLNGPAVQGDRIELDEKLLQDDKTLVTKYIRTDEDIKLPVNPHGDISKLKEYSGSTTRIVNYDIQENNCKYVCAECGSDFTHNKYLIIHKKIHHKDKQENSQAGQIIIKKEPIYESDSDKTSDQLLTSCEECVNNTRNCTNVSNDEDYGVKNLSKNSTIKIENADISQISSTRDIEIPNEIKLKQNFLLRYNKKYRCHECDMEFSKRSECLSHRRSVHLRRICSVCGTSVRSDHMPKHMRIHQDDPIACQICNKIFKNKPSLRSHLNLHKGMKYECELCKRTFKVKNEFHRHLKYHKDPSIRKSSCKICGKIVCDLRRHMLTHTGERPYSCKFCEKGFTSDYALKVHLRQHTNEKPFVCEYCSIGFTQKVSLSTHLKSKHGKNV